MILDPELAPFDQASDPGFAMDWRACVTGLDVDAKGQAANTGRNPLAFAPQAIFIGRQRIEETRQSELEGLLGFS